MKLGLMYANAGPAAGPAVAVAVAQAAEAAGLDSLWTVEHVIVPVQYASVYPYNSSGRMGGEDLDIPDPLIWLAYVAARTERIRLATGILILPQRNPLVTAKSVASLDALSGGRVILGVGIGWLREEFEALGVPFEGRGARTDEWVGAMRALWKDDTATFSGSLVSFRDVRMFPKPVLRRVPVVVGGHTESAARRAGRLGDGFFPGRVRTEDLAGLLAVMRRAAVESGRDPDAIEVTAGGRPAESTVQRYAELGVDRMVIAPPSFEPEALRESLEEAVALLAGVPAG